MEFSVNVCKISHFRRNDYAFMELSVADQHIAVFTEIWQIHGTFIYSLLCWSFHRTIMDSRKFHWLMSISYFFHRTRSVTDLRNNHGIMEILQIHGIFYKSTGLSQNCLWVFQYWYLASLRNYFRITELTGNFQGLYITASH